MTLKINRAALVTDIIQSAALGALDSIAHPLLPDTYAGEVWLDQQRVGGFAIEVTDGGDGDQIDIDLSEIAAGKMVVSPRFTLRRAEQQPAFAVFHCGGDATGFHVLLRSRSRESIYDSRLLQPGDYYIVTPVKPGVYAMAAARDPKGKGGTLTVEKAQPTEKPRVSAKGAMISVTDHFDPPEARILSGDGVVFEIKEPDTAVVIILKEPAFEKAPRSLVGVRYTKS